MQTAGSWTRENTTGNNFLYNASNELNQNTGWYEMFFRGYDPATGRMLQIDPYATMFAFETAYSYSGNNPISFNDPNGAIKKRIPHQVEAYISDADRGSGGGGGGMNTEMAMASMGYEGGGMLTVSQMGWMSGREQMIHDANAVRRGSMSHDAYAGKYGEATFGAGGEGLTQAYVFANTATVNGNGVGSFVFEENGQTYGRQYFIENGVVTSVAINGVSEGNEGGWLGISSRDVYDTKQGSAEDIFRGLNALPKGDISDEKLAQIDTRLNRAAGYSAKRIEGGVTLEIPRWKRVVVNAIPNAPLIKSGNPTIHIQPVNSWGVNKDNVVHVWSSDIELKHGDEYVPLDIYINNNGYRTPDQVNSTMFYPITDGGKWHTPTIAPKKK